MCEITVTVYILDILSLLYNTELPIFVDGLFATLCNALQLEDQVCSFCCFCICWCINRSRRTINGHAGFSNSATWC